MRVVTIDLINLYLLLFAFSVAYVIPFELLLISYAFLGPLHYLTEISWLHDRKYYTLLPSDPIILTATSLLVLLVGAAIAPGFYEFIWILLILAFCTTFVASYKYRLAILSFSFILLFLVHGSTASFAASVLIPTVIHVFVFTLFFMLFGAIKSKSPLAFFNAAAFFVGAVALLLMPSSNMQIFPEFVQANYGFFSGITLAFSEILGQPPTAVMSAIASFLAFTYTYHYLNWFSKTSIIEWHKVSLQRAFVIGFLYAGAVGLYLYDYGLGLTVLLSLSFLHVVLEFPLNFRSIQGLLRELR